MLFEGEEGLYIELARLKSIRNRFDLIPYDSSINSYRYAISRIFAKPDICALSEDIPPTLISNNPLKTPPNSP